MNDYGYVILSKNGPRDEWLSRKSCCMWESIFDLDLENAAVFATSQDALFEILSYSNWVDEGAWIIRLRAPTSGWSSRRRFSAEAREKIMTEHRKFPPRSERIVKRLNELMLQVGIGGGGS